MGLQGSACSAAQEERPQNSLLPTRWLSVDTRMRSTSSLQGSRARSAAVELGRQQRRLAAHGTAAENRSPVHSYVLLFVPTAPKGALGSKRLA